MRSGDEFPIDDWSTRDEQFATISDRAFVRKTFHEYPSLRSKSPRNGYIESIPYRGQAFDANEWLIVPGGWNHEHCSLCWTTIKEGMTYSVNGNEVTILCDYCRDHYTDQLQAKA